MQKVIETESLKAWRAGERESAIREGRAVVRNGGCTIEIFPSIAEARARLSVCHNPPIGPADHTAFITGAL